MQFTRINFRNTRIVESASIEPGAGFNYFVGDNGAGKTSLLEGIHILSTGSSFRTRKPANLIRYEQATLQSFAEFIYRYDEKPHTIGVERARNGTTQAKIDRAHTHRLADLTQTIPILALHPEIHQLINGSPLLRRKLIDWGVFHVEPDFIATWREYKRLLEQRNAALKQAADNATISVWDKGLAEAGERLHGYRASYLSELTPFLRCLLAKVEWGADMVLSIRAGWNEQIPLIDELSNALPRDRLYRSTSPGPHRAELVIKEKGNEIRHVFSRGQQKLFIYLLKIAQANHLCQVRNIHSVFLCDDLPAELDENKRKLISNELLSSGYQVFATSVNTLTTEFESLESRVFHVEHGHVRQVL